jgi:hypothetical protein
VLLLHRPSLVIHSSFNRQGTRSAGQNAQTRQIYNASADTYYKASDAAAYDDLIFWRIIEHVPSLSQIVCRRQ